MKTKEEILKSQEYLSYFLNGKCEKLILDAMEQYAEQQVKLLATPDVSVESQPVALGAVCPNYNNCINGGKNEYCDLETFEQLDCYVGQTER
jgi:hypothetical protein